MAKLKLKLDVKKIKEVLTSRFEILGLAVAGALAAICFVMGVAKFVGAGSPEDEIKNDIKRLSAESTRFPPPAAESKKSQAKITAWPAVTSKDAQLAMAPMFEPGAAGASYRVNPKILALDNSDPKGGSFQLDYIYNGIHTYEFTPKQDKLYVFTGGTAPVPVVLAAGKRLIVVSGTFPYEDQVKQYLKALRLDRHEDLFAKGYAPTFEGLNVDRRKIAQDGKTVAGDWEKLYFYDSDKEHLDVAARLEKLLQSSLYDSAEVDKYHDVIYGASVTPLPLLTNDAKYPDIVLPEIVNRKKPTGAAAAPQKDNFGKPIARNNPFGPARPSTMPAPADKDRSTAIESFTNLAQALQDQVSGKINIFSPYGTFPEDPAKKVDPATNPPPKPPDTKSPGAAEQDSKVNFKSPSALPSGSRALVRFVDVDVEPGATYQYRIQVRMANPNLGLSTNIVAHSGLAKVKELVSDWVETPPITVPADQSQFYITNQDRVFVSRASRSKSAIDTAAVVPDKAVPFQIHRFVDVFQTKGIHHYVADWVVAERVLVSRGETIGRDCEIEMAEWDKVQAQWHVSGLPAKLDPKRYFNSRPPGTALLCSFRTDPPIVLLDFVGGKQSFKNPLNGKTVDEDSAPEVLLLMPDGTMRARNGQDDTNDAITPDRRLRFEAWRDRLESLRKVPELPKTAK